MDLALNPVIVSVVVLCVLSLCKLNVLLSMICACLVGGLCAGIPLFGEGNSVMSLLCDGFAVNAQTALAYILLGAFAETICSTGLAEIITRKLSLVIGTRKYLLLSALAIIAVMSQNIVPIHIAFIPILIPPILVLMNRLQIDRRAAACALAFGLEAPYIAIPFGFGLIFQTVIATNLSENGMPVTVSDVTSANWWLGAAMLLALLVAIFVLYRKPRAYKEPAQQGSAGAGAGTAAGADATSDTTQSGTQKLSYPHYITILAIVVVVITQIITKDLSLSSLAGLFVMIAFKAVPWKSIDSQLAGGVKLMGLIAFVMLIAGGYANVIKATGGVDALVAFGSASMGDNRVVAAFILTLIGLVVTMGIGTSFGTVPVLAVLFVPLCQSMGFSVPATIVLISAAAALGDAGSPASDTTLGPTSGLNADGQHDHIWDTCVPTFLVYNSALMIAAVVVSQFI